jgi:hypothetical protein
MEDKSGIKTPLQHILLETVGMNAPNSNPNNCIWIWKCSGSKGP